MASVARCSYGWLRWLCGVCVAMGGYRWLCVAMGGYTWLRVAMYGYVSMDSYGGLCMAMCDHMSSGQRLLSLRLGAIPEVQAMFS